MNDNQPFGLPEGTIRGLLAFTALLGSFALLAFDRPVPEWMVAIIGGAVMSYFALRPPGNGGGDVH